jgi:hypothetical protein
VSTPPGQDELARRVDFPCSGCEPLPQGDDRLAADGDIGLEGVARRPDGAAANDEIIRQGGHVVLLLDGPGGEADDG